MHYLDKQSAYTRRQSASFNKSKPTAVNSTHLEPDLGGRVLDALVEDVVDLAVVAVVEPDGEQAQSVLQAGGLLLAAGGGRARHRRAELDAGEEALDGGLHVRVQLLLQGARDQGRHRVA